jgi:hypothetical protein
MSQEAVFTVEVVTPRVQFAGAAKQIESALEAIAPHVEAKVIRMCEWEAHCTGECGCPNPTAAT